MSAKEVADFLGNGLMYGMICVMFMCPVWLCYVMARVVFQ